MAESNKEITEIISENLISEICSHQHQELPLGLRPRKISDQARIVEICEAIARYAKSGLDIPTEWIDRKSVV